MRYNRGSPSVRTDLLNQPIKLRTWKSVAATEEHTTALAKDNILHEEVLGIISNNYMYRTRRVDVKDIATINQHLANNRESHKSQDEVFM